MSSHTRVWVGAGVLGLMSALSLQACEVETNQTGESAEGTNALGGLALGLSLPDGSNVTDPTYTITRTSDPTFSLTGTLVISGQTATAAVSGLPSGNDYKVVLSASRTSPAGAPACTGSATFTVLSNQTTNVNVVLQCDDTSGDTGNVTINGEFNICPKIGSTSATPVTTTVGSTVSLTASATDKNPADVVKYTWSAADGTFSAANAASTSYTCVTPGSKTINLSVTDGPARGCTKQAPAILVTCVAASLDAGVGDAGSDAAVVLDGSLGSDAGSDAGVTSSKPSYLLPSIPGVVVQSILTVGDSANLKPDGVTPYRMVGIPDGLGAYDNGNGTFTLLSNHELGNAAGIARAHGGTGAFVSKWTLRTSDLRVLKGEDLIQQVQLWNKTTSAYALTANVSFNRFCSADLAPQSAFNDAATSTGYQGRLFLNGEEGGDGRAIAHEVTGLSWELPRLGRQAWENNVASPSSGLKTVVVSMDDTTPGQVYVYVGTKTNTGSAIERAGLTNGSLFGVKVTGVLAEVDATVIPAGPFTLAPLGNVENKTMAQLESDAMAAGITSFLRPEDGAWDPSKPNDFYFVTTNGPTANSRLWRLRFTDVKQPELGGTIEAVLAGNEGHRMFDNIAIDPRGHIIAQEDMGNNARLGKVWRYTIATDSLVEIAAHDPALFTTGAPGFLTQDEEASGIIDATDILGAGWFLLDTQAHYATSTELVEGGQYLRLYDPGSL